MLRIKPKEIIWLLLTFDALQTCWSKTYWSQCNQATTSCSCKFVAGKKQANCANANLKDIPDQLDDEIQALVLDNNSIRVLRKEIFRSVSLINLQTISLRSCKIEDVDKHAFRGLSIVISIDLTGNEIKRLDPLTFSETERLRHLYLNNNQLQKLDDFLFSNLTYLQTVEFDSNQISHIGSETFSNLKTLTSLKLKNNQLTHLEPSIFRKVPKLTSLEIQNNPWKCDCSLREFLDWTRTISVPSPVYCDEPDHLKNRSWESIKAEDFACKPDILWPRAPEVAIEASVTLNCQVTGNPKPETYWTFNNSRILNNNSVSGLPVYERKYIYYESGDTTESGDTRLWCNLTITKLSQQDKGIYTCVAKNPVGVVEKRVTI